VGLPRSAVERTIRSAQAQQRRDPHVTPQPRGTARLAARREPDPGPAERAQEVTRPGEPCGRVAVLEADPDGPESAGTEHPADPETRAPEREREHQAAEAAAPSEPDRQRPFARPEPEPEAELEAGE